MYDSYARLSWNLTTRELGKIEDQLSDNGATVERLGGTLGEELSDWLSAWKRNMCRPGWDRLLERAATGEHKVPADRQLVERGGHADRHGEHLDLACRAGCADQAHERGLIEYDGAPVGRIPGEPIVEEATLERIRAKVAARRRVRMPKESCIATGVLRCGVCGHKLSGRKTTVPSGRSQKRYCSYYCPKIRNGCAEIESLVVERLSGENHAAQVGAYTTHRAQRLAKVRESTAQVEELSEALVRAAAPTGDPLDCVRPRQQAIGRTTGRVGGRAHVIGVGRVGTGRRCYPGGDTGAVGRGRPGRKAHHVGASVGPEAVGGRPTPLCRSRLRPRTDATGPA